MNRYTFILLVNALSFSDFALGNLDGEGGRKLASRVDFTSRPCRGLLRPETVNVGGKKGQSKMFCETSQGEMYRLDLPETWIKEQVEQQHFHSGITQLMLPRDAMVDDTKCEIKMSSLPQMMNVPVGQDAPMQRHLQISTGERSLLVVRVKDSRGVSSTDSESELADTLFGSGASLQNQYRQCSHDKLNFYPAMATSNMVNNGATTVQVNVPARAGDDVMVNAITVKLNEKFGVTSPSQLADHILYCLPEGTMSGVAYAYLNHWLSVYNNEWCGSLSAKVHELGHNLNLGHSNEDGDYEDKSGMMGYSYFERKAPEMCFNASKSWQLGWYSNRHFTINEDNPFYVGEIVSIVEDPEVTGQPPMLIKLETGSGEDFYVNFNARAKFNSGTQEGGDNVLIVKAASSGYSESELEAKLTPGTSFTIKKFRDGEDLTVEVFSTNEDSNSANVAICWGACPPECSSDAQCYDDNECTTDICSSEGLCANIPIESGACGGCPNGSIFNANILTDRFPAETSWKLFNKCTGDVELESESYDRREAEYSTGEICLSKGKYDFVIEDSYGDGICCGYGQGSYSLMYDGRSICEEEDCNSEFDKLFTVTFGEECYEQDDPIDNTSNPTGATRSPVASPSAYPTQWPTITPTKYPSSRPTKLPSVQPSKSPSFEPSSIPTKFPSFHPTLLPTKSPTFSPEAILTPKCGEITRASSKFCKSLKKDLDQGFDRCDEQHWSDPNDNVGSICPVICGVADCLCVDDEFVIHKNKSRSCEWALEKGKCSKSMFLRACPKTCGICKE